jgi:hypothetical protein
MFWDSARQFLSNAYGKVKGIASNVWSQIKGYLPTDFKEGGERIGNAIDSVFNKSNSAPSEFPDRPMPMRPPPNYKLQPIEPIDPRASSESTAKNIPPWVLARMRAQGRKP